MPLRDPVSGAASAYVPHTCTTSCCITANSLPPHCTNLPQHLELSISSARYGHMSHIPGRDISPECAAASGEESMDSWRNSMYTKTLDATFIVLRNGVLHKTARPISGPHLDTFFKYKRTTQYPHIESSQLSVGDLVLKCPAREIVNKFSFWTIGNLRQIAVTHHIPAPNGKPSIQSLSDAISAHDCSGSECANYEYVFQGTKNVRVGSSRIVALKLARNVDTRTSNSLLSTSRVSGSDENSGGQGEEASRAEDVVGADFDQTGSVKDLPESETQHWKHLEIASEDVKRAIAEEWEELISTDSLRDRVCAVCARGVPKEKIELINPDKIHLELLRNDALPDDLMPVTYHLEAYERAILHPKGLTRCDIKAEMYICTECARALIDRKEMPKFSLANFLYYAHERLPPDVRVAFKEATWTERTFVSRGRASKISMRFSQKRDHYLRGTDERTSQSYIKGNVAIHPQDVIHLNEALPPSREVIKDMICAVLLSSDAKITRQNIKDLRPEPMLCRKSRLTTIIKFLTSRNPFYAEDGTWGGFNQRNLDDLFGGDAGDADAGIPCAIEIGCLQADNAVEAATESYLHVEEEGPVNGDSRITMDSVGYTLSDGTPLNPRELKILALKHCLAEGEFLQSRSASRFIPDFENPRLLTWLFPHLDPWGIGGFFDPRRTRPLTLDEQLKYLLSVHDSPFRDDPDFAFVYYNIRQKKAVFESVTFRVSASEREQVVSRLLSTNLETLDALATKFKNNPQYRPEAPSEKEIVRLLARVNAVSHDLPGTNGYKVGLRNKIRSMINYIGTPTLFVTLNPSDREHPLVRLYAGDDIDLEDATRGVELDSWERSRLVAENPAACARFFHTMITSFIQVVLKYGTKKSGLFGKCVGYFGTVEAQGRGTLHCHMLIWLEGHPSPQKLRDMMAASESYQTAMIAWLESTIKCELLGTKDVVIEEKGKPSLPPPKGQGRPHPGTLPMPSVHAFEDPEDYRLAREAYVNELVATYNWHKHKKTCFKYAALEGTIPRDPELQDQLCRMRIDGSTHPETSIDPETGSILLRRLHPRIANFNEVVMQLLRGNMDIKFIGSGEAAEALTYYVTNYITKASLSAHVGLGALAYAIKKTNEAMEDLMGDPTKLNRTALTATVNRMMSRQELSHQQVMSYLIGGGDHYTSHTFKFLHWRSFDSLFRKHFREHALMYDMTLPNNPQHDREDTVMEENHRQQSESRDTEVEPEERLNVNPDSEHVTGDRAVGEDLTDGQDSFTLTMSPGFIGASNQQQDYVYRSTDEPFDDMCLYEFVGGVEKIRKRSQGGNDSGHGRDMNSTSLDQDGTRRGKGRKRQPRGEFSSESHTQFHTHTLRQRTIFSVPVLLGDRTPRSDRGNEEKAEWARMMLILFIPWRNPSDLRHPNETWLEAYERQNRRIPPHHKMIIANMNVLSECRDARDSHSAMRRAHAMALLNEWLPQDDLSNRHNPPETVNDEDEEFEIIRSETAADSNTIGVQTLEKVLDTKIGQTARIAFDHCFDTSLLGDPLTPTAGSQSRQVTEEDQDVLGTQISRMRQLKRIRRPQETHDDNPRPRVRRRLNEVEESVQNSELEDGSPRRSRNPVYNSTDIRNAIDQVVEEMGLHTNVEQERAFRIVGEHIRQGNDQLLMYIAGVGGTGKTHVVKSIRRLFELLNRSKEILIGAPTGAAAKNIDGYTVHSLAMMRSNGNQNLTKLQELWGPVKYFIIDEVSMIGAKFLSKISARLQQAKGLQGASAQEPFGGVHVIFTGDFGQLRPVSAKSLYDHHLVKNPSLQVGQTVDGVNGLQGVYLWRLVRTVVKLTKNQRQRDDPMYADLLSRVRVGQCNASTNDVSTQSDVEVLFKRIAHRVLQRDPAELRHFADAPVIVGSKVLRDAINTRRAFQHATSTNETCHFYHSRDKMNRAPVHRRLREPLWDVASGKSEDSLGRLPLFPGMRVMIQENLAFSHGLVNGAEGTVEEILWEEEEGHRYATVAYVRVPGSGLICPEKGLDIVPIFPETARFEVQIIINGKPTARHVSRRQLPLLPAYAYTDYKSQGKSLNRAIVDIESAHSLQGVYVMLSRVRTLDGLLVLRPFVASRVCRRLSQELREELERIDALSEATRIRFERERSGTLDIAMDVD